MKTTEAQPDIIRQFFLEENPNPDRIGCPPEETLQAAAENKLPVNDPARLHMASCSECFAEYRSYRIQWEARKVRRRTLSWAVAAALLVSLGGALLFQHYRAKPLEEMAQSQAPSPPDTQVVSPAPKEQSPLQVPKATDGEVPRKPVDTHPYKFGKHHSAGEEPSADPGRSTEPQGHDYPVGATTPTEGNVQSVTLELKESDRVLTDRERAKRNIPTLPAAPLNLTLVLPGDAPVGSYRVVLGRDRKGEMPLVSANGTARKKAEFVSVTVNISFVSVPTGQYFLLAEENGVKEMAAYQIFVDTDTFNNDRPGSQPRPKTRDE